MLVVAIMAGGVILTAAVLHYLAGGKHRR
jgi:hypothetical protein